MFVKKVAVANNINSSQKRHRIDDARYVKKLHGSAFGVLDTNLAFGIILSQATSNKQQATSNKQQATSNKRDLALRKNQIHCDYSEKCHTDLEKSNDFSKSV